MNATESVDCENIHATGANPIDPLFGLTELGMVAANVVARAKRVPSLIRSRLSPDLGPKAVASAGNGSPTHQVDNGAQASPQTNGNISVGHNAEEHAAR